MRKSFSLFSSFFVLVFLFKIPIFAVPDNVLDTTIQIRHEIVSGTASLPEGSFPSGELISYGFWSSASDNYVSLANFSGTVPFTYDIYVAVLTSSLPYISFGGIDDYYDATGNLTDTVTVTSALFNFSNNSFTANSPLTVGTTDSITFCYFHDVPAGTTFLVNDANPYPSLGTSYIHAFSSLANANVNFSQYLFGAYFGYTKVSGDGIIDGYLNGSITLSDAISGINSIVKDSISGTTDYTQSTLNVLVGQSQIDELLRISDNKSLSSVRDTLLPQFDSVLDSYSSGVLSIDQTLNSLNDIYQDGLSNSDTAEQGTLVNTTYDFTLKRLQVLSSVRAVQKLDSAISDDDLASFNDYYLAESDLMSKFDIADLKSQIDYDTWMLQLPTQEAADYKKFFDYLLTESPFRFFVLVPMSCGLISILLGTRIHLSSFVPKSKPSDNGGSDGS